MAEHLIFSYSDFTPGLKQGYNCESVGKKESEREREIKGKREREREKERKIGKREREGGKVRVLSYVQVCNKIYQLNIFLKSFFAKLKCAYYILHTAHIFYEESNSAILPLNF